MQIFAKIKQYEQKLENDRNKKLN